jgi:hypothetical protein
MKVNNNISIEPEELFDQIKAEFHAEGKVFEETKSFIGRLKIFLEDYCVDWDLCTKCGSELFKVEWTESHGEEMTEWRCPLHGTSY